MQKQKQVAHNQQRAKEPLGLCSGTPFAQEKVDGSTLLIDGAIGATQGTLR
jgi:hypothetical protein